MKYLIQLAKGFLIVTLFLTSCKKSTADLPASLQEIIKNSKGCQCNPYIDGYIWNGNLTYMASCGGPACSCIRSYFTENGEQFELPAGYTFDKFVKESKFVGTVWKCE